MRTMNPTRLDETGRSSSQRRARTATSTDNAMHDRTHSRDNASSVALRRLRKRRGECLTCGTKTHSPSVVSDKKTGSTFQQMIPLNVEGVVSKGICLKCNPTHEDAARKDNGDIGTVPSEIRPQQRIKREKSRRLKGQKDQQERKGRHADRQSSSRSVKKSSSKRDLLDTSIPPSSGDQSSSQRRLRSNSTRSTTRAAKGAAEGNISRSRRRLMEKGAPSQDEQHQVDIDLTAAPSQTEHDKQQSQTGNQKEEEQIQKEEQILENEVPKETGITELEQRIGAVQAGGSSNSDLSTLGQESVMSKGVTLKRIRERNGLCSECGNRTHTFVRDEMGVQTKQPCTTKGLVHRGRCLRCYPLPQPSAKPVPAASTEPENVASSPSPPKARTEPMKLPAPSVPTEKPKSILRRSSSYGSVASSKSGKSGKSVTIVHDDDEDSDDSDAGAQLSSRSIGNKSSTKSNRSLFGAPDDAMTSSSSSSRWRTPDSRRSRRARKDVEAALHRLNAINDDGDNGGPGALVDIVATMRQNSSAEEVQALGASMLYDRSKKEGAFLGRSGGIPTILEVMKNHENSSTLHVLCCKLIRNLADAGEYNRKVLAKHGAFNLLCDTMERNLDNIAIQCRGCAALAAMAEESKQSRTSSKMFDYARVLGVLVGAVSAFPEHEDVLRRVYNALKAYGYKPMTVLMKWQNEEERKKFIASLA
mmetsp:Transcript_13136/g.29017  ORF Transcript_13136/g.29017 Transcript_13136/m.29017 type:complete len:701 (+) Transcript_13136:211-2313(+)